MEFEDFDLACPKLNVVENLYYYNKITTTSCVSDSLTEWTLGKLKITFDNRGLSPSPEMWTGLRSAIQVMADMADGGCAPAYYVSSLDPGVGKTTAMVHFLRELVTPQDHLARLIHGAPSGVSCAMLTGGFDRISGMSSPPPGVLLGG
jgi:hypothetical protein